VRWGVTVSLLWAWVLTIPISALLAAFIYYILHIHISLYFIEKSKATPNRVALLLN
jgi:hypothetical protein